MEWTSSEISKIIKTDEYMLIRISPKTPMNRVHTLAWLIRSPTNVETSMEPDRVELFLRISCFRKGNAVAGGSSGIVTVYECRMLGIINTILLRCINNSFK